MAGAEKEKSRDQEIWKLERHDLLDTTGIFGRDGLSRFGLRFMGLPSLLGWGYHNQSIDQGLFFNPELLRSKV
jgi:hypothetical protein